MGRKEGQGEDPAQGLLSGWALFWQQTKALMLKNALLAWRNKPSTLLQLFSSFFFILLIFALRQALLAAFSGTTLQRTITDPPATPIAPIPPCQAGYFMQNPCYDFVWAANFSDPIQLDLIKNISANNPGRPINMSTQVRPINLSTQLRPINLSTQVGPINTSTRFGPINMSTQVGPPPFLHVVWTGAGAMLQNDSHRQGGRYCSTQGRVPGLTGAWWDRQLGSFHGQEACSLGGGSTCSGTCRGTCSGACSRTCSVEAEQTGLDSNWCRRSARSRGRRGAWTSWFCFTPGRPGRSFVRSTSLQKLGQVAQLRPAAHGENPAPFSRSRRSWLQYCFWEHSLSPQRERSLPGTVP